MADRNGTPANSDLSDNTVRKVCLDRNATGATHFDTLLHQPLNGAAGFLLQRRKLAG